MKSLAMLLSKKILSLVLVTVFLLCSLKFAFGQGQINEGNVPSAIQNAIQETCTSGLKEIHPNYNKLDCSASVEVRYHENADIVISVTIDIQGASYYDNRGNLVQVGLSEISNPSGFGVYFTGRIFVDTKFGQFPATSYSLMAKNGAEDANQLHNSLKYTEIWIASENDLKNSGTSDPSDIQIWNNMDIKLSSINIEREGLYLVSALERYLKGKLRTASENKTTENNQGNTSTGGSSYSNSSPNSGNYSSNSSSGSSQNDIQSKREAYQRQDQQTQKQIQGHLEDGLNKVGNIINHYAEQRRQKEARREQRRIREKRNKKAYMQRVREERMKTLNERERFINEFVQKYKASAHVGSISQVASNSDAIYISLVEFEAYNSREWGDWDELTFDIWFESAFKLPRESKKYINFIEDLLYQECKLREDDVLWQGCFYFASQSKQALSDFNNSIIPDGSYKTYRKSHFLDNSNDLHKIISKAKDLYNESAASKGSVEAQYEMAKLYHLDREKKNYNKALEYYLKAARQGHLESQISLGEIYSNGKIVSKNDTEAVKWYRKAAEQGNTEAQYQLGERYYNGQGVKQNYQEVFKWYRKAAEQGHDDAQINLGYLYDTGKGVAENDSEAVKWYLKSAEQGHKVAQSNLGFKYLNGEGVAKDEAEAVKWFRKSAKQGYAKAQYQLGERYYYGQGVNQNYQEAFKWYERAGEQEFDSAYFLIGFMYDYGQGVAENDTEAVKWYRRAAKHGIKYAQSNLAFMYLNGEGVAKDEIEAVKLFRKSATQGYDVAQFQLGNRYFRGEGIEQNYVEAFKWYNKAAEQGYDKAQIQLGLMYEIGKGTVKNISEAIKWYLKSVKQGSIHAKHNLGLIYLRNKNDDQKAKAGLQLLKEAANGGLVSSQILLGKLYEGGYGEVILQNRKMARAWYRKAAENGNEKAKNALKNLDKYN